MMENVIKNKTAAVVHSNVHFLIKENRVAITLMCGYIYQVYGTLSDVSHPSLVIKVTQAIC